MLINKSVFNNNSMPVSASQLTQVCRHDRILPVLLSRPHRLAAQDAALSRPKQGFESPWGHSLFISKFQAIRISLPPTGVLREGHRILKTGVPRRG